MDILAGSILAKVDVSPTGSALELVFDDEYEEIMLRIRTESIAIVNDAMPIYLTLLMIVVIPPMDTSLLD